MPEAIYLIAATLVILLAMMLFALSLNTHWRQVMSQKQPASAKNIFLLRFSGSSGLILSMWLCLLADHPSMAILVWIMLLALGAIATAFTLAWKTHWLQTIISPFKPAKS